MTLHVPSLFRALSLCLLATSTSAFAAGIEADPNKDYRLTKSRGPWMIKVATLHTTDPEGKPNEGKSPEQAAQELVLELRNLGMPAYVYEYDPEQEHVVTTDRLNREQKRKPLRRYKSTCVLAGNYSDINDKTAQDSLAWIKKLHPKCFQQGVSYRPTPGHPGPLSAAFLTPNPLLTEEDMQRRMQEQHDPLLVRLNSGERYSLYENPGEYTLVVARFYGKKMAITPKDAASGVADTLFPNFLKDNDLDNAALSARELVTVLRGEYDGETTNFNKLDAYIWHDHHESIVTVGSFAGPTDPSFVRVRQRFAPKMKDLGTGTASFQPEHLAVGEFGPKRNENRMWLFEPDPQLMRVPRVKK